MIAVLLTMADRRAEAKVGKDHGTRRDPLAGQARANGGR
jgi:hypothetical protein